MASARLSRQLVLELGHDESFAPEDFIRGAPNAAALTLIERWPDWPDRIVALSGPPGAGKSHLAAIWAARSGARMIAGAALGPSDIPALLSSGAVVIDDLAEGQFDERALFHCFNMAREARAFMLLVVRGAPAGWNLQIPDIASRLRAIPLVAVDAPDDRLLRAVFVKLVADRQMQVDDAVINYVLLRIERSFLAVRAAVALLDAESMGQKRPVTRALAADLFRDAGE